MPQKLLENLKSGEAGDHFNNQEPNFPIPARFYIEIPAACEGALSCMKVRSFLSFGGRLIPQLKLFIQQFLLKTSILFDYFFESKGTQYLLGCYACPQHNATATVLTLSGLYNIALHSLVKITQQKFSFKYFIDKQRVSVRYSSYSWWRLVSRVKKYLLTASTILRRRVLPHFLILASRNKFQLVEKSIFFKVLDKCNRSRFVTFYSILQMLV